MQLILSNADLTSAVTAYLGSVLTVNETAQVQVELTEDGAIVVITPAGQQPEAPVVTGAPVVKTRGKRTAKVTEGKLSTTEGPIVEKQLDPQTDAANAGNGGQIAGGDNSPGAIGKNPLPGDAEPEVEQEEEQEPVAEEPKPVVNKATSLFANLNRPKN
ncbi:MAG: hypothetical protein [Bacteriophage sp.]|nr:MAG: hypothetical protein [Bacteriophage sp.]